MNVENLFTKVGEVAPANTAKASAWQNKTCKKTTEAGRRVEKGMGSEPLGHEEFAKAQLITLFAPAMTRALTRTSLADWNESPHKRNTELWVNYLVRTHVPTERAAKFADDLKKTVWKEEEWAEKYGCKRENTPIGPGCDDMAATLFLADAIVACLCLGKENGVQLARQFINMLSNAHVDNVRGHDDKLVVTILGTCDKEQSFDTSKQS